MSEIRLTVRCAKDENHAKVLRIDPALGLGTSIVLAAIEAGGLIGIAAWRLDGFVDRLPA